MIMNFRDKEEEFKASGYESYNGKITDVFALLM